MAPVEVVEISGKHGALCRSGAALSSPTVGVLPRGTEVEVLSRAVVAGGGGGSVERLELRVVGESAWCSAKVCAARAARTHGWECETDSGWAAFDADDDGGDVDAALEASFARMDEAPVRFVKNRMRYEVDVVGLEQRNVRFGTARKIRRRARRRPRPPPLAEAEAERATTRVFAVSDCHVDYEENMAWLGALPDRGAYANDVILVAGDLGHTLPLLAVAFLKLKAVFKEVCFCVGNHELWVGDFDADASRPGGDRAGGAGGGGRLRVFEGLDASLVARADALAAAAAAAKPRRGERLDSLVKLDRILHLCAALGVRTAPLRVAVDGTDAGDLWICPLLSWYAHAFARPRPDAGDVMRARGEYADFALCEWPPSISTAVEDFDGPTGPAAHFAAVNARARGEVPAAARRVVTFSHFLPRPELMPRKRPPAAARLDLVAGDARLESELRARGSRLHVFGHTHVNWDACVDGVHYVQNALRYPHERKRWTSRVDAVHAACCDAPAAAAKKPRGCAPCDPAARAASALDALRVWTSASPDDFCILPRRCSHCKFS